MQHKTTKEALVSIINRLKNSKIFFKSFYEKNKDKFDKIEGDIEGFENQLNHLNDMLNIYKSLLFISKTKEELFENMELIMTRPDGSPLILTEDIKETLFENSKPFQMFMLLLEFSRTKYKDYDFTTKEHIEKFEKLKEEQFNIVSKDVLDSLNETNSFEIQEGSGMKKSIKRELSYINNEKAYVQYIENLKNQIGGSETQNDYNKHRFVKVCYTLDEPLPLKIPTMEFLNFKLDDNDNTLCIDIEYPWWPNTSNMMVELLNKADIKQCIKDKCVEEFKDVKYNESDEKRECVNSCYKNAEPSIFDFTFFPLWTMKKYDPFGVINGGVGFVRFFLNQLDSTLSEIEPTINFISGFFMKLIGIIPLIGNVARFFNDIFNSLMEKFGNNFLPWLDAYLDIIDKNFEQGFATYVTTIPNSAKAANSSESTAELLENITPIFNKALSGINTATGVAANLNFTKIMEFAEQFSNGSSGSSAEENDNTEKPKGNEGSDNAGSGDAGSGDAGSGDAGSGDAGSGDKEKEKKKEKPKDKPKENEKETPKKEEKKKKKPKKKKK